ncbi:MAG: type II secretion system protein J, partial [Pirellulaceae bacterium]
LSADPLGQRHRIRKKKSAMGKDLQQRQTKCCGCRRALAGFTLVEVLIATALSLLMMMALAEGFKRMSDSMTDGRANLALSDRLRSVTGTLRNDLERLTLRPQPPQNAMTGSGYFEYYEGPITDYSATVNNVNLSASIANGAIPTSRFGDVDDILMFTARAMKEPFKGKVPFALLRQAQDATYIPTVAEWNDLVTISSEYAEIVYFMLPAMNATTPIDAATGRINVINTKNPGFPDEYRLFRRVLLIRPDLNRLGSPPGSGVLTNTADSNSIMYANPSQPMLGMASLWQRCDLSLRRVSDGNPSNPDPVAANSLEDLALRENRFAHGILPSTHASVSGYGLTSSCTMPLLALTTSNAALDPVVSYFPGNQPFNGFLHPSFALSGVRAGEDILMANAVGFDLRGYDPKMPTFYVSGPDGVMSSSALPDDQTWGAAKSDDLLLGPMDPGFAMAMRSSSPPAFPNPAPVPGPRGGFADLGWGLKVMARFGQLGYTLPSGMAPYLVSPLSGLQLNSSTSTGLDIAEGLFRSGLVIGGSGANPLLRQVTFDSWSNRYEVDGRVQREVNLTNRRGTFWINGLADLGYSTSRNDPTLVPDRGGNGLEDEVGGIVDGWIDDPSESDTMAPFPFPMGAVQVLVRTEDPGTGLVQQMSVVQDFVTQ